MKPPQKILMIISSDRISEWIKKGEVTARYFNPGNLFDEVHFVLLNEEAPDIQSLQKLVGQARFHLHTFPTGVVHFCLTAFWNRFLLRLWSRPIVNLTRKIQPNIIRCHGANLNAFVALQIKKRLNIPYLISLHINPDEDIRQRKMGLLRAVRDIAYRRFEAAVLRGADLVMPVYEPIIPYLKRLGVSRFEVAYNFLNLDHLKEKTDYRLHNPIRVLSVGRQFREKNPENLILAMKFLPEAELTLVGDGAYHEYLQQLVRKEKLSERVIFKPVVSNDTLCSMLTDFDIFATHTEYWEISKSVLEPLLSGLPVILNRRQGKPVPELSTGLCLFVENSPEGYLQALKKLIEDHKYRENLGKNAYKHAMARWSPKCTEEKFVELYERSLNG